METFQAPMGASCFLTVLDEVGRATRDILVAAQVTIGRESTDSKPDLAIPARHGSASRQHAHIEIQGDRATLTDTSKFGTIVNGKVVQQRSVELHNGDEIIFGLPTDGWRVRFRVGGVPGLVTSWADPLESLTVCENPREVRIGTRIIEEHLGGLAFRLLKFLTENKGRWYPVPRLQELLWPDPDKSPYQGDQALSRFKKSINDMLHPYLNGHDAIDSWPHRGYRMKARLDDTWDTPGRQR